MSGLVQITNPQTLSTQDAVEYFLSNESDGTAKTYGAAIRGFFAWSRTSYRDVTPFDALGYNEYLKATDAESTVQRKISTLNSFFSFCKECGLIGANPFAVVKQKRAKNKVMDRFLTLPELDRLLEELHKYKPKAYVLGLLLASLGLRISEARHLSHCDFIESPNDGIEVRVKRKGGKVQLISLREDVWQAVRDFMGHDIDPADNEPLFKNAQGDRANAESLGAWIKLAAKRAGIKKDITAHWLRHTTATHLLAKGESLENVGWLLGHASVMTTRIYTHPTDKNITGKMPIVVKSVTD